jgi:hypothetical protein
MKEKDLYMVNHHHRFGTSLYLVRSDRLPMIGEVIKALQIDFEPDREETLEIDKVEDIIDI